MRALLALAALLVFLTPAAAFAHGGVHHALDEKAAAAGSRDQSWSPVCPPGSGHVCSCGNLTLCDGAGKPVLAVRYAVAFLPPVPFEAVRSREAPAQPAPQFAPNSSRAPPAFS